jgi:hypothetical protein
MLDSTNENAPLAGEAQSESTDVSIMPSAEQSSKLSVMFFNGQGDTHKYSGEKYLSISLRDVFAMVTKPDRKPKNKALALMASNYCEPDGRTHEAQRKHGHFVLLRVDIDKGNTSLSELLAALVAFAGTGVALVIYSTSSASPTVRKWRGIIALPEPIGYPEWHRMQRALHLHLTKHGIQFDGSMERAGQYMVAPNKTSDFYLQHIIEGDGLDVNGEGVVQALAELDAADVLVEVAAKEARIRAAERKSKRVGTGTNDGLIEAHNASNPVADGFDKYGFDSRNGVDWHHPQLQTSCSYSWRDFGDYWVCASASACVHGIGAVSANGFGYGDSFDLFVHFEHDGNVDTAIKAASQTVMVTDPETGEILSWHEWSLKLWVADQNKDPEFEPIDFSEILVRDAPESDAPPAPYPGPMADLVAAILATSRRKQPALALCSALAAMAAACPGCFYLPAGGRLNLYIMGVVDTGMGKEHPRTVSENVAATAGAVVLGAPSSGEGLEDNLPESADVGVLVAVDEVAHLLGNLNDPKAAPYHRTLSANLLRLFSAGAGGYRGRVKAGMTGKHYTHPSVTLLGYATPQKLGISVGLSSVTDGLLGRMLVLFGDEAATPQRPDAEFCFPETVSVAAQLIRAQCNIWTQVNYTPQADARLERALQEFELGARDPTEAALRRRSYEKADRIAGVLAVWDAPASPVITLAHVEWAIGLVNASNAAMWRFLNKHMHEGNVQSNAAKVLEWCHRILSKAVQPDRAPEIEAISAGAVPRSLVLKRSKLSAKELADATQHLTVQGDLEPAIFKLQNGKTLAVFSVL